MSKFYGIFIGIDDYKHKSIPKLNYAVNDALALYETILKIVELDKELHLILSPKNNIPYDYQRANMMSIWNKIALLADWGKKDDYLWIFFSGHGVQLGDDIYLLGEDSIIEASSRNPREELKVKEI